MKKTRPQGSGQQLTAKKQGQFQTLSTGLQTLVEEIEKQLKLTKVYKGTKVTKLSHSGSGYSLELDNGVTLDADSVIVTAPHKAAAGMLSEPSCHFSFEKYALHIRGKRRFRFP